LARQTFDRSRSQRLGRPKDIAVAIADERGRQCTQLLVGKVVLIQSVDAALDWSSTGGFSLAEGRCPVSRYHPELPKSLERSLDLDVVGDRQQALHLGHSDAVADRQQ